MPIRILVADDHGVVRAGLVSLLGEEPDMEVVGEACSGAAALRLLGELRPDIALVDIGMPDMTGIDVLRRARESGAGTAVVLLTQHKETAFVKAALEAGAAGYVVKAAAGHELLRAVRAVAAGDCFLSAEVTRAAIATAAGPGAEAELTPRERDVLRLLAEGLTSKEVAARLGLRPRTVDAYRLRLMEKLGVHHGAGLVKQAIRLGLAKLDG